MARSPSSTRVPRSSVAARLSEIVPPARPALTGRLVSRAPSQATLSSFSGTSVSVRRLGSAQAATSCVTRALASSTAPAAFGAPSVPLRTNAPLLGPAIPASRAGAGRPPARPAARAPGAARAARFHAPAEARDVQHAFGVPDQRDGRLLERQVGELDVAHEERPELQREAAALELEEGGGAELRVLAHLEVGELERGPREERDGHGGELHGPAERLRRGGDDQRLAALLPRLADLGAPPLDLLDAVRLARAPELVALGLQARVLLGREPVGDGAEVPARDAFLDVGEHPLRPLGERGRVEARVHLADVTDTALELGRRRRRLEHRAARPALPCVGACARVSRRRLAPSRAEHAYQEESAADHQQDLEEAQATPETAAEAAEEHGADEAAERQTRETAHQPAEDAGPIRLRGHRRRVRRRHRRRRGLRGRRVGARAAAAAARRAGPGGSGIHLEPGDAHYSQPRRQRVKSHGRTSSHHSSPGRAQGIRRTLPVVLRPSNARCASAASFSGNSNSVRSRSLPSRIQPSTSPARWSSSARVAVWWTRLGRVRKSDPFWFRICRSNPPMGPLDWPQSTILPRAARQLNPLSQIVFPTES